MSSRCKACNRQLSYHELVGTQKDQSPEDMCVDCRNKAMEGDYLLSEYIIPDPHEYGLAVEFFKNNNVDLYY